MIAFLISLLILLLYAAIAMLVVYAIAHFYAKIFGEPVPARVLQLVYVIIALIFIIWFVQALATNQPIPTPWK